MPTVADLVRRIQTATTPTQKPAGRTVEDLLTKPVGAAQTPTVKGLDAMLKQLDPNEQRAIADFRRQNPTASDQDIVNSVKQIYPNIDRWAYWQKRMVLPAPAGVTFEPK
jgi:hypothetical protein